MSRRLIPAGAALGVLGLLVLFGPDVRPSRGGAPGDAPAGTSDPSLVTKSQLRQIERGDRMVIRYDDGKATIETVVLGDAGSWCRLQASFEGLYVLAEPSLTYLKASGVTPPAGTRDLYRILPKTLRISFTGSERVEWIEEDSSRRVRRVNLAHWGSGQSVTLPDPPGPDANPNEIGDWYRKVQQTFERTGFIAQLIVQDERAKQGPVRIVPNLVKLPAKGEKLCAVIADGVEKSTGRTWHHHQAVSTSLAGTTAALPDVAAGGLDRLRRADLSGVIGDELACTLDRFDLRRFACRRRVQTVGKPMMLDQLLARGHKVLSDKRCDAEVGIQVQLGGTVEATLQPVEDEAAYMPVPGDVRQYKLTLKVDPDHVQAIRFKLDGVSSHAGAATNAGCHLLYPSGCPHCTAGRKETHEVEQVSFHGQTISKLAHHYNDCPIDRLPDLYFTDADNPGFELGEGTVEAGLRYKMTRELLLSNVIATEHVVKVRVMDSAACGRLRAEVLADGIWWPAEAEGSTADASKMDLLIPLDRDSDGIADAYNQDNPGAPTSDDDLSANDKQTGDGLTLFEEYRGCYVRGSLVRTRGAYHDLFVYGYGGLLTGYLDLLAGYYARDGVTLHVLCGDEQKSDCVNYQPVAARAGEQYAVVVMDQNTRFDELADANDLDAYWENLGGKASHVGPPTKADHTVLVRVEEGDPAGMIGRVGHEIGHNINCTHHGRGDRVVALPAGGVTIDGRAFRMPKAYVAVKGGQHSGPSDCFMRYVCANLFCDDRSIPEPAGEHLELYHLFPLSARGTRERFCTTVIGDGANDEQKLAGDAEQGPNRPQIRIKSY